MALILGFVVMILGLVFLDPLSKLLGSTDTILPYTKAYLSIILIGAPYMTAQLVLNNQIRFQGNALFRDDRHHHRGVLNIFWTRCSFLYLTWAFPARRWPQSSASSSALSCCLSAHGFPAAFRSACAA